jgi:16S rRNA (uracil1498-N3)-methyltransferase
MEFIHFPKPTPRLVVEGEKYRYLFRVRRTRPGEIVPVRDLKEDWLYFYRVEEIGRRRGVLKLEGKEWKPVCPSQYLQIGWCIVDPKIVEKGLPHLNEIGVSKISFIYCDFSQRNFRLKMERITRILIESCQQCGRSRLPEVEILNSSREFFQKYPNFVAIDFGGGELDSEVEVVLVGPEGGFSPAERKHFSKIARLKGFILKSETAVCGVASKILL